MNESRVVSAGELAVEELLDALEAGERVIVRTAFLGSEHEVTLRYDGRTFYCDTPTRRDAGLSGEPGVRHVAAPPKRGEREVTR